MKKSKIIETVKEIMKEIKNWVRSINEKNPSRNFGFERDFSMRLIKIGRTWIRTMDLHIISVAL